MYKSAKNKHARNHEYDLQADLERIKTAITDAAFDVKGKAGAAFYETLDNARERSVDLRDNVGNYAKERPFKTMGISMLTGILIGYWLHK